MTATRFKCADLWRSRDRCVDCYKRRCVLTVAEWQECVTKLRKCGCEGDMVIVDGLVKFNEEVAA